MTVHLLPVPVDRDELDLRLRSLRMPPEAVVVVEAMGLLDDLDRRLTGVVWKVIGREVPPTEGIPDYPFLRLEQGGTAWRQVQIWEWHICPTDSPAFAISRWHPWGDEQLHFLNLSQDAKLRLRQCRRLGHLVEVTDHCAKLGRPIGSVSPGVGKYEDANSFLEAARRARDARRRRGSQFTQAHLAEALGMTEGTFRRGLRKCRLTWETFLRIP